MAIKKLIHIVSYPMVWIMASFYRASNLFSKSKFLSIMDVAWTERWNEIISENKHED